MVNLVVTSPAYADNFPTVYINVNGQRIYPDSPAFIKNDRTLVPLRGIFEKLGANIQWDADQQKITVTYGSTLINLQIDDKDGTVNGTVKKMDVAPTIYNNRTMIPLRFISENIGLWVQWVPEARVATITDPSYFDKLPSKTVLGFTTNDYVGDNSSYNSLASYYDNINSIATFSYKFDTGGNLQKMDVSQQNTVSLANSKNIKPLVLINNYTYDGFDNDLAHAVLSNASKRAALINNILVTMSQKEYSGVNIDIENLYWSDRPYYTAFVKELKQKLTPYGFLTTLSIPAKTGDAARNEWDGAFDYSELGKYADRILLMTYDEHYFGSDPGPIASAPWVENVLDYATSTMPSNKLLLGIAGYGYDWSQTGNKAVSFKNIDKIVSDYNAQVIWDAFQESPHFSYSTNGVSHEVWYEDERSISSKLDMVSKYQLGGIGIWRLGYDNENFWSAINSKMNGASSASLTSSGNGNQDNVSADAINLQQPVEWKNDLLPGPNNSGDTKTIYAQTESITQSNSYLNLASRAPGLGILTAGRFIKPLGDVLKSMGIVTSIPNEYIKVDKSDHILSIYSGNNLLKSYHVELSENGLGDKQVEGDHKTPEGTFYIAQKLIFNPPDQYLGSRWMMLSYPNIEDADRGLAQGLIDRKTHDSIVYAVNNGLIPPQDTPLGSGIGIHGGSSPAMGSDWTWGCVGLTNSDVEDFYNYVSVGTKVIIQP